MELCKFMILNVIEFDRIIFINIKCSANIDNDPIGVETFITLFIILGL